MRQKAKAGTTCIALQTFSGIVLDSKGKLEKKTHKNGTKFEREDRHHVDGCEREEARKRKNEMRNTFCAITDIYRKAF